MELSKEETIEIIHLIDGRYNELLFISDMVNRGIAPRQILDKKETIREDLYRIGKMLLMMTEKAHKSGFCACPDGDDSYIMRCRQMFGKEFKRELESEDWVSRNLNTIQVKSPDNP